MSHKLKEDIMQVLQEYNPAKVTCMSVYQPIVPDLLTYWSYSDSEEDVRACMKYLFMHHFEKSSVPVPVSMVSDIFQVKVNMSLL